MSTLIGGLWTLGQDGGDGLLGSAWVRGLALIALVGGLFAIRRMIYAWAEVRQTREREETKREIAAYIAEGTMAPDVGERLINGDDAWRKRIADLVENQHLDADDAERLLRAGNTERGRREPAESAPVGAV